MTLHPEIEEHIQKIIMDIYSDILPGLEKHNVTLTKEHFDFIRNSIRNHLGPYLLPPSQHLKDDEPEFIMLPRNLWQPVAIDKDLGLPRHPKLGDDVVYYIKKKGDVGMTYCPFIDEYIDTPEHCVKEDNEPLPEKDLSTGTTISQLGKDLMRARMMPMEQSTPKIEKLSYLHMESGQDIEGNQGNVPDIRDLKINELVDGHNALIDYINNKD